MREARSGWRYTGYLMYRFTFFGMRAVSDTEIGNLPRWYLALFSLRETVSWFVPVLITRERLHRLEQSQISLNLAVDGVHRANAKLRPLENQVRARNDEMKILRDTIIRYGGPEALAEADARIHKEVCYIVE